jgi:hypothetical protein
MDGIGTVVGGFANYLSTLFDSTSTLFFQFNGGETQFGNWSLQSTGLYASQYMSLNAIPGQWLINGNTTWDGPVPNLLDQINELAFRTAIWTAQNNPNSSYTQVVEFNGGKATTVYQSNHKLMTVAVLVNLLGLISLLPIYYGWWELGRKITLSPLETAKAFGAPMPRKVNDNATVERILRQVGKRRIRYGEILVSGRPEAGVSFVPA